MNNKVTFISGSLGGGGAERVLLLVANHFVENGVEVDIHCIHNNKCDYEINSNISYNFIEHKFNFRPLKVIEKLIKLRCVLKKVDSEYIISFLYDVNIYTILSSMFLKKKIIVSERNNPYSDPNSALIRIVRNLLYNLCTGFVFQTQDAKLYFNKYIQKRSVIIPNPLKNDLPFKDKNQQQKNIVSVCRLEKQKNIKMSIDAFVILRNEYPEYKLYIYGEGSLRDEIEKYIILLGLNEQIILKGFEKNVHNEISNSSMFISSSDYEGISNSMIECLAIGIPVICTDCPIGGARMFIKTYENGILIPVGDTQALYKAMKFLIENPNDAVKISDNAIKIREKLDADKICEEWLKLL